MDIARLFKKRNLPKGDYACRCGKTIEPEVFFVPSCRSCPYCGTTLEMGQEYEEPALHVVMHNPEKNIYFCAQCHEEIKDEQLLEYKLMGMA